MQWEWWQKKWNSGNRHTGFYSARNYFSSLCRAKRKQRKGQNFEAVTCKWETGSIWFSVSPHQVGAVDTERGSALSGVTKPHSYIIKIISWYQFWVLIPSLNHSGAKLGGWVDQPLDSRASNSAPCALSIYVERTACSIQVGADWAGGFRYNAGIGSILSLPAGCCLPRSNCGWRCDRHGGCSTGQWNFGGCKGEAGLHSAYTEFTPIAALPWRRYWCRLQGGWRLLRREGSTAGSGSWCSFVAL